MTLPLRLPLLAAVLCAAWPVHAQSTLDTIGVTALRNQDSTLTGAGVIMLQVESAPDPFEFEVNPATVQQPVTLFAYRSTRGRAVRFPNSVGSESGHADQVAQNLYGNGTGVAPGLRHISVMETDYFLYDVLQRLLPTSAPVINQSFESGSHDAAEDQLYDDYISLHHTVIVSGVGNGGGILSPADCYNGIGDGAYGGSSSSGPTADGRCKPDLVAPAGATSFSTPLVSGAAAVLIQAGRRLGPDGRAAADCRTVKALLLNGADKPGGWSNTSTAPLDPNYGAGVLDLFASCNQLSGGLRPPSAATAPLVPQGHPPVTSGATIGTAAAWDFRVLDSSARRSGVNHYRFNASGTLTATLVWNRDYGHAGINHLALYLYNSAGQLIASSESKVDNVQHLYLTGLAADTYDLEVVKPGGAGLFSARERYALAWDFAP